MELHPEKFVGCLLADPHNVTSSASTSRSEIYVFVVPEWIWSGRNGEVSPGRWF